MTTYIKPDPESSMQEEDLLLSYLNADYLSNEETPLSPPLSTSSETTGSPASEKNSVDDFMMDFTPQTEWMDTALFSNAYFPTTTQPQPQVDLLNNFPFFLQSTAADVPVEQPKKKRGRKKREPVIANTTQPIMQQTSLLPKPLAPRPGSTPIIEAPVIVKQEPKPSPTTTAATNSDQEAQKQAQIQKRQERLIKNRAAALLSRKRKREHLTSLEEEKNLLVQENEQLLEKVSALESKIQHLEKENLDLKQHLQITSNPTATTPTFAVKRQHSAKSTKTTGVVFMIILFSFALFTLPSRTADRLTVGGSILDHQQQKKQFPLIGSSQHMDYTVEQYCEQNDCVIDAPTTTDLVLIDPVVRPRDLQTWISHKLNPVESTSGLQTWSNIPIPPSTVYLYSKEFAQLAPLSQQHPFADSPPIVSLISPYNTTVESEQEYLQIDVQVLRSTVIKSQLLPFEQCPPEIIGTSIRNNVTRVQREKTITARAARVLSV